MADLVVDGVASLDGRGDLRAAQAEIASSEAVNRDLHRSLGRAQFRRDLGDGTWSLPQQVGHPLRHGQLRGEFALGEIGPANDCP